MIDYLAYISVKFLSLFFMLLPIRLALFMGKGCGLIFYYINAKKRRLVYKNLRLAFADVYSLQELRNLSKRFYKNFGQNLVEALIIPKVNENYIKKYMKVDNLHYIDEAVKKGKGAILLTFHFGNWEISHIVCSLLGYPFTILVKPQRHFKRLSNFLESCRIDKGCRVIETGMMTREIMKALKNNQAIGMAADQSGRDGMLIPFLNREASLPTGALRFALKCQAPIIPVFTFREKGPYQHIVLERPLYLIKIDSKELDIYESLTQIKALAERYIKTYPEQYFWFYKVWKYSLERSVIILSDGKTGHLRQSQSVLKVLGESKYKINPYILEIKFKSKIKKLFFNIVSFLDILKLFRKRLSLLRFFITPECYQKLTSTFADIVLSCGTSLSFINLMASYENNGRSVVIMKPPLWLLNSFGLAIIPEHDNPPSQNNIIKTIAALNLIDKEYLENHSQLLARSLNLENNRLRLGIIIGGDTKNFSLKKELINELIVKLKEIAVENNAELLVSTSRRTSSLIDNLLKSEFKSFTLCKLLVIASEKNIPEAVGGILGLSDIVIVSCDSVSMVSEAASSGKYVIVFDAQDKVNTLPRKHKELLNRLKAENYIYFAKYAELKEIIRDILRNQPIIKKLNERETIKEALFKLF